MSLQGINYTLLHSAATNIQGQPAQLTKVGITEPQLTDLITVLNHAMHGNPTAFEASSDQVAQAFRILETSNPFSSHPKAAQTLDLLRPLASQSTWARHAAGSSGIFGSPEAFTGQPAGTAGMKRLTPADIDFEGGFKVMSGASKFVVPLGDLPGAVPLVYPQGHEKAGQPIVDWQGKPIGERGIVFFNYADSTYQAAAVGQNHVIIFNNVTPEQADQLYAKIAELTGDPRNLTHGQLVEVLEFAKGIGLGDRYNSDTGYIQKNMVSARSADTRGSVESSYGSMNRNRDLVSAVSVKDGFVFEGEQGAQQRMPYGGVVVRVGDKVHAVQPDVFRTTYTLPDGQPVTSQFLLDSLQAPGQSSGTREIISFKSGGITYEAKVLRRIPDGSVIVRIGGGSIHRLVQLPDAVQGAAIDAPSQATGKLTAAFTQLRTTGRGATEFRAAVEAYLTEELGRRPTEAEIVLHLTEKGERSRLEIIRGLTGATEAEFAEVVEKAREGGALPKSTEAEAREGATEQKIERTRRGK